MSALIIPFPRHLRVDRLRDPGGFIAAIEAQVERMIDFLDGTAGDPDLEPDDEDVEHDGREPEHDATLYYPFDGGAA